MAPEIRLLGGSFSQPSDVYSYGVILKALAAPCNPAVWPTIDISTKDVTGCQPGQTAFTEYDENVPMRFIKVSKKYSHMKYSLLWF